MTAILGISGLYHDSAAALVVDGEVVAAAQEERFSRKKHDAGMPVRAMRWCVESQGLGPGDLDYVAFYDKPMRTFERLLETYLSYAPAGFGSFLEAMPRWLRQKLHAPKEIKKALGGEYGKRIVFTEHHEAHAASAFFPSPFEEAAILTMDGVGEWATTSWGTGRGNRVELTHELHFPHSLGLLYSAFTYYCGFRVNDGEYKLMGLAPYGEPRFVDLIESELIDVKEDGSFRLHMQYFNYCAGLTMTSRAFDRLFGAPPRAEDAPITQRDMDLAASIQVVTEKIVLRVARHVHAETGMRHLCLAGGVALNCVANGRILREGPFDEVWIQPAAGDAGGALGAALTVWYQLLDSKRVPRASDFQQGSLLGPSFADEEIGDFLREVGADFDFVPDDGELCDRVASAMADGRVVGWFQGRMEYGPRALGARSILGDPRNTEMQATMNLKVKFRESFRPFAPAVLRERTGDWFEFESSRDSPYMLVVTAVRKDRRLALDGAAVEASGLDRLRHPRSELPAVTHVDDSARIQTVDAERHGLYRRLIEAFEARTGCPVVINTSFNLGWEPVVCTPRDAYETFMSSGIDVLCMGHHVLEKRAAPTNGDAGAEVVRDLGDLRDRLAELWVSPCCTAELEPNGTELVCAACRHGFPLTDGIPQLFWPHEGIDSDRDVTETVKSFYEETPFPNYDEHDSVRSLIEKSRRGLYARALDEAIGYDLNVLEVGCGTGQLSNFLGISSRRVVGTDMCLNSLRLGDRFRREHGSPNVHFLQMNLFRPCLRKESFDVLLCNGVLHHTADPRGGFAGLVPLVKPGGYVVIGLYNTYGRLMTDLRRGLFRMVGGRARWIDPYLRSRPMSAEKQRAWFADQYQHPHESKHTTGEVLRWFEEEGVEFLRGVPALVPAGGGPQQGGLFEPAERGTPMLRALAQLGTVASGNREGGFFIMIGRKRG